jgi:hypothetical protein
MSDCSPKAESNQDYSRNGGLMIPARRVIQGAMVGKRRFRPAVECRPAPCSPSAYLRDIGLAGQLFDEVIDIASVMK